MYGKSSQVYDFLSPVMLIKCIVIDFLFISFKKKSWRTENQNKMHFCALRQREEKCHEQFFFVVLCLCDCSGLFRMLQNVTKCDKMLHLHSPKPFRDLRVKKQTVLYVISVTFAPTFWTRPGVSYFRLHFFALKIAFTLDSSKLWAFTQE
jgi:hypothetical protein